MTRLIGPVAIAGGADKTAMVCYRGAGPNRSSFVGSHSGMILGGNSGIDLMSSNHMASLGVLIVCTHMGLRILMMLSFATGIRAVVAGDDSRV